MSRTPKSLLLFLACLCPMLASCVDSENPLSDPKQSTVDPNLLGVWRSQTKEGDVIYYHVGKAGDKFPSGMLRTINIQHNKKGDLPRSDPSDTLVFSTTIGNNHYLNIKLIDAKFHTLDGESSIPEGYFIYKYEIKDNKLEICGIDSKQKTEAVKTGKIKGIINGDNARITDTTENLARFFATQDAAKLFVTKTAKGDGFATFERVK